MLRQRGWQVNHERVERLWFHDGSFVRRRSQHQNRVWSYDFVHAPTAKGRAVRLLTLMGEQTGQCLAIRVERKLSSEEVIETLADLFARRGVPKSVTVDNGTEFVSRAMEAWSVNDSVRLDFIRPGRPMENAFIESFNARLRDECLNVEIFDDLVTPAKTSSIGAATTAAIVCTVHSATRRPKGLRGLLRAAWQTRQGPPKVFVRDRPCHVKDALTAAPTGPSLTCPARSLGIPVGGPCRRRCRPPFESS